MKLLHFGYTDYLVGKDICRQTHQTHRDCCDFDGRMLTYQPHQARDQDQPVQLAA
jgi:hypothetical protein